MDAQPEFGRVTDEIIASMGETVQRPPLCTEPVEYEGQVALNVSKLIEALYERRKQTGRAAFNGFSQGKIDEAEEM